MRRFALAGLVSGVLVLGAAGPAFAAEVSQTFTYTGEEQVFEVPAGVTNVHVVAVGGNGGTGHTEVNGFSLGEAPGGAGGVVIGDVPVSPGRLYVEVGGSGGPGQAGFNGGGAAANEVEESFTQQGGGGGGASDVRTASRIEAGSLPSRLIVAGGGGGGGAESQCGDAQPGAGGAAGEPGEDGVGCAGGAGATGGGAGTSEEGGAGGSNAFQTAGAGGFGFGGGSVASGGGGGGLWGGGGGASSVGGDGGRTSSSGGGGGSDLVPAGGSSALDENGVGPSVTISYVTSEAPSCSAATGSATYLRPGANGRLKVKDALTTDLSAPQTLRISYQSNAVRFHLTKLEEASCTGTAGSRVFSGKGAAAKGRRRGYTMSFSIREQSGGFYFSSVVMKGEEVVEITGGPLRSKSQTIG
jgi:hypothetical protein